MDAYKAPQAELTGSSELPVRPAKGLILGLVIIVVIGSLVSLIEGVVFAIILGIDLVNEQKFEAALAGSPGFLIFDLLLTGVLFFWGGRAMAKHVPGQEMKYAIVLTLVSIAIYVLLYVSVDSLSAYPMWYNVLSFVITVVAIIFGARSRIKKKTSAKGL